MGTLVKVKVAQLSPTLCDPMDYSPWHSPGQNTGVGSLSLLQGIFPAQGSNSGLPYCRWILYQLSHKGSPGTLEVCLSQIPSGFPGLWQNGPHPPAITLCCPREDTVGCAGWEALGLQVWEGRH